MGQDSDVARVAAAMNAPGFKYRSFGNEPVRIRPGTAGTLAQPAPETAPYIEELLPPPEPPTLLMVVEEEHPPESFTQPFSPGPLAYEDAPPLRYAYDDSPEPAPAAVMVAEPPPPEPPLFSWPETPANPPPMPTMVHAPVPVPEVTQAYAPSARPDAAPMPGGGFRLLESMGHRAGDDAAPRITGAPAGGTLGRLRRAAEDNGASSTTLTGMGMNPAFGAGHGGPLPPLSPSGHQSGLLPAAAVTVPLSDVMRLIAAGATPPPSPFDAFRAALGAQPGR